MGEKKVHFENSVPILNVRDLAVSIAYYHDTLGFHINWQEPDGMAEMSRDAATIMLCQGKQGCAGAWVWVGVSDAGSLYEQYHQAGANIRMPPTNFPWAFEMQISDPDGHVLRFGSDPLV